MFFLYYILMREACGFSGYVIGSNDCIRASLTCLFPELTIDDCSYSKQLASYRDIGMLEIAEPLGQIKVQGIRS